MRTSARGQPDRSRRGRADTVAVPLHRTLDGFVEAVSQADGIGLTDVDAFTTLVVQTDNSVYQIHDPSTAHAGGVRPGRGVLPRTETCVSERVELWR